MKLNVTLVLHDVCKGWIIEKMAHRLCEALNAQGVSATVSHTPSPDSQVNHYMIFHYVEGILNTTLNTAAVTHVDDALKIDMLKRHVKGGIRALICMSHMTEDQLATAGIPRSQLTYALPACDGTMVPRRIVLGITSNRYADDRKREWLLKQLAKDMKLDAFEFRIFGSGWEDIAPELINAGAKVTLVDRTEDYVADYERIKQEVPQFDYYLYLGLDEGSMGTLDALAAGVPTIVTLQGFHLDIPHGITHGFWEYEEFQAILQKIAAEKQNRSRSARQLTWSRYAQRHIEIWESLLKNDTLPRPDLLSDEPVVEAPKPFEVTSYWGILKNPFRRRMAMKFFVPKLYYGYIDARMEVGRWRRRLFSRQYRRD